MSLAKEISLRIREGLPSVSEAEFPPQNGFTPEKWEAAVSNALIDTEATPPTTRAEGILDNILDAVGATPMVRISRFAKAHGLKCELIAKCEFLNPGGSLKDRIAKAMVEHAERTDRIRAGSTLIEPTSGNTGIGLSMASAVKGYNMIITLPEKMSQEKVNVMKVLGAEILRTPTEAAWNSPESHIGMALKLSKALPDSHVLDQYSNLANPLTHYYSTAHEILRQCDNKLDMIVISAGTGGAITGIGRRIKEVLPDCEVVGVDPRGSVLAEPDALNDMKRNQTYLVEGIGYDFIPSVLDRSTVDRWVKTDDGEAFAAARELIKTEGMLVGGSAGSTLVAAIQTAAILKEGQRCCVVLADASRNYLNKFVSDSWMINNGFIQPSDEAHFLPFEGKTVSNLKLHAPVTVFSDVSVANVVKLMASKGIDQIPVVTTSGAIMGVVTEGNLASYLQSGRLTLSDAIEKGIYKQFRVVPLDCPLAEVFRILESNAFVVVTAEQEVHEKSGVVAIKQVVVGVVTRIDLLQFLTE